MARGIKLFKKDPADPRTGGTGKDPLRCGEMAGGLCLGVIRSGEVFGVLPGDACLERLKGSFPFVMSPEGMRVPFCAENLTSREGASLYRRENRSEPR